MKEIVIQFEPFVFKQTVFIKDGDNITQEKIPQKELANYISLQEDLKAVHFFGNVNFANKLKNEFITKYKLKEKDVNILINK